MRRVATRFTPKIIGRFTRLANCGNARRREAGAFARSFIGDSFRTENGGHRSPRDRFANRDAQRGAVIMSRVNSGELPVAGARSYVIAGGMIKSKKSDIVRKADSVLQKATRKEAESGAIAHVA